MPNNEARLVSLRAADGGARLLLCVETVTEEGASRETLPLFSARLERLPKVGVLNEAELSFYRAEAEIFEAVNAGLRVLSAGGCSRRALILKLRHKGISSEAAAAAAKELAERGYLRETEGAVREAERGIAKLWGNKRILMELRAKGYGAKGIEAAAARLAEEDAAARCARLVLRRRLYPRDETTLAKIVAALTRYGYTRSEITRALLLAEQKFDV